MRSIRLSLTVYFLVLLALALGGASLLFYRTTQETLQDKARAAEELIQAGDREDCRKENEKLDTALLRPAQDIAKVLQFKPDDEKIQKFNKDYGPWMNPLTRPAFPAS